VTPQSSSNWSNVAVETSVIMDGTIFSLQVGQARRLSRW
jgi:hypothetical protein